jgi:hypothetical protein
VIVAPGQGHDGQMLPDLLEEIRVPRLGPGRPRTTPDKVLGDKAYSSRATRTLLRNRGIVAVIPEPRDQRLKQWRGLATRYDKLAIVYRAAAVLAAVITWLRHLGDTL